MGFLLLQIIPVAVGIAVNPVPIIAALIMAGTRRPVANGGAFVAALVVVAVRKPAPGRGDREPRWMALIERMGPAGAAIVGVLLVNYEMQAPALADILHAHLSLVQAFVALTVFIAIAASTPAVPLALSIAAPGRVLAAMGPVKTWLTAHNRPILLAVFGVVGVIYTIKGVLAVMH